MSILQVELLNWLEIAQSPRLCSTAAVVTAFSPMTRLNTKGESYSFRLHSSFWSVSSFHMLPILCLCFRVRQRNSPRIEPRSVSAGNFLDLTRDRRQLSRANFCWMLIQSYYPSIVPITLKTFWVSLQINTALPKFVCACVSLC